MATSHLKEAFLWSPGPKVGGDEGTDRRKERARKGPDSEVGLR